MVFIMPEAHKRAYIHPKYKTSYQVRNWPEYEKSLRDRGDVTVWLSQDAIDAWQPEKNGKRGGQNMYSDMPVYEAVEQHSPGATVVVPPRKDAVLSNDSATPPAQPDSHIAAIQGKGRFKWKRESGYYLQSHVENAIFRYKTVFGGRLRSKK